MMSNDSRNTTDDREQIDPKATWYQDRTSLLCDAEQIYEDLSAATNTARWLCESPQFDESYKIRARRINVEELRSIAKEVSALEQKLRRLYEKAYSTWEHPHSSWDRVPLKPGTGTEPATE